MDITEFGRVTLDREARAFVNEILDSVSEHPESAAWAIAALFFPLRNIVEHRGRVGQHKCPGWDCAICTCPTEGWGDAREVVAIAEGKPLPQ